MSTGGRSWWSLGLAATGGTVAGALIGSAAGLLLARALGLKESIAHTGQPFYMALSGAWLMSLLGCYIALAMLRDPKARVTVIILALILPGSAVTAGPLARAIARWFSTTFGTLVTIGLVLSMLLLILSPIVARVLAAIVPWERRS